MRCSASSCYISIQESLFSPSNNEANRFFPVQKSKEALQRSRDGQWVADVTKHTLPDTALWQHCSAPETPDSNSLYNGLFFSGIFIHLLTRHCSHLKSSMKMK